MNTAIPIVMKTTTKGRKRMGGRSVLAKAVGALRSGGFQASRLAKRERRSGFKLTYIMGHVALEWEDFEHKGDREAREAEVVSHLEARGFELTQICNGMYSVSIIVQ